MGSGRPARQAAGGVPARQLHPRLARARPALPARVDQCAFEVDLTGQVGAEVAGEHYLGGIGGQADLSGAAARTGARSIIVLRAANGTRSTIVPRLRGPVTTARADVDVVVTEHGAAHPRGCSLSERARRLAAVATPEHGPGSPGSKRQASCDRT
ncbi:MAG TPA: acetyl-CoA hydrolase/transferase C-terminal domain-containing protein [Actinophytocola sp.]|nr:acetyl-CoA hydrolase/transferase C-terminal domain-containing protein [Actinophytocola sp.]